jgi:hypothetical protein
MDEKLPKLAICGPGRCGKDTAAAFLASRTPLRFGRTTSEVIAPYVANRLGVPVQTAFTERHAHRQLWFDIGNELRATDPAFLVRETLLSGEISVGMRNRSEIAAVVAERLVDLIIWIDRDVPPDPTMEFEAEACNIIVPNRGTLDEFYNRLESLARWARLLRPAPL